MTEIYSRYTPQGYKLEEIRLTKHRYALERYLDRRELENFPDPQLRIQETADYMAMQLVVDLFGQESRTTFQYPDGWWQAFRERFFPEWWLNSHPVRNKEVEVVAHRLFPALPQPAGDWVTIYTLERMDLS